MCGIIGYVGRDRARPLLLERASTARVPRLRLGRDRAARGRRGSTTSARSATSQNLIDAAGPNGSVSHHGPRPHALGDPRRRHRAERAPAHRLRRRQARDRPQRDRRELPRAERAARGRGPHVHVRDRRRGGRPPARARSTTATSSRRSARLRAARGPLLVRRRSTTTSPTCSSASGCRRRSSSASARARTSSPRSVPRSSAETRSIQCIEDGEVVEITPDGVRFLDVDGARVERRRDRGRLGRGERREGAATRRSCSRRSTSSRRPSPRRSATASAPRRARARGLGLTEIELRNLRRIVIVACGTAYHAGVVGRYILEEWARRPGRARHRERVDLPQPGARRRTRS